MDARLLILGAVLGLSACARPSDSDAGMQDSGSHGEGDAGEARPERFVVSDDGLAVLWIPDGGVPSSTNITVTARHRGAARVYQLEPSGLTFAPAAWMLLGTPVENPFDAGVTSQPAVLVGSDGGVEKTVVSHGSMRGHSGPQLSWSLARVKHFSQIVVGHDSSSAGQPYLGLDGPGLAGFHKSLGEGWGPPVTVSHFAPSPITALPGTWSVSAAGAAEIWGSPGGPIPGAVGSPAPLSFTVACKRDGPPGPASFTLRFDSLFHEVALSHTVWGTCSPDRYARASTGAALVEPQKVDDGPIAFLAYLLAPEVFAHNNEEPILAAHLAWLANQFPASPPLALKMAVQSDCQRCELRVVKGIRPSLTPVGGSISRARVTLAADLAVRAVNGAADYMPAKLPDGGTGSANLSFECTRHGLGELSLVSVFSRDDTGVISADGQKAQISCDNTLQGDAIMLSDNTRVSRSAGAWTAMAPGVTANVIQATAAVQDNFFPVSETAIGYGRVPSFASSAGLTPLRLRSARQNAIATFNGTRYAFTGLVAGAAYDTTDTLVVEHQPASGPAITLSVPAPPPEANLNALLGAPMGWDTTVAVPDGAFDTLYVFVAMTAPAGAPAGEYGLMRLVRAADLPLAGGRRSSPLLDAATKAEVSGSLMRPSAVYVAYFNTVSSTGFFTGRAVPVQAGRMFQLAPADLGL